MSECTRQKAHACASCPWVKTSIERGNYFDPDTLDRTTVQYLREEKLHPCHSSEEHFCTGYLSYVVQHVEGGIKSLWLARMAIGLGILDCDRIDRKIPVFESIEDMLDAHRTMFEWENLLTKLPNSDVA